MFGGCFTENRMKGTDPIELHINFTFPENGLPPMKLHLGNVAEYLTEKPGQSSSLKRVVMVNITNPNKPNYPIPAEVFAAGLPVGALIPGDIAKPCRTFIVGKCNNLCSSTLDSCQPICDGRRDCLQGCRANAQICSRFCNSTFDQLNKLKNGEQENPTPNYFLPKCLRNCRKDRVCNSTCHRVCHTMLQKKDNTAYENPKADLPDFEAEMDDELSVAEEGVSQNDQLE